MYLVRVVRVDYPGQPKVSDLEQQLVGVDEYVGGLQISVQDVRRVDELQSPQQLVEQQRGVTCSRAEGIRKNVFSQQGLFLSRSIHFMWKLEHLCLFSAFYSNFLYCCLEKAAKMSRIFSNRGRAI